jgi:hypothetical protein
LQLDFPRRWECADAIGIHVDRDDPDMIHVSDANHSEIHVPRKGFSDWLNAHLATVHGDNIERFSVHRDAGSN